MADALPKPTKGSGILRFSEDIYLELKYDLESEDPEAIVGHFHVDDATITLLPAIE